MTVPVPADPDSDPARTPWHCPYCGYDARGRAIGDPCAECGGALGRDPFRGRWRERRVRRRFALGAWGLSVASVAMGIALAVFVVAVGIDGPVRRTNGAEAAAGVLMFGAAALHLVALSRRWAGRTTGIGFTAGQAR